MDYRKLGGTDFEVSRFSLGTMAWGWTADETQARAIMDAFWEAGGNFIDTANTYSNWVPGNPGGIAEQIIGRWIGDRGNRKEIILATKVGGRMGPGLGDTGLSRAHIGDAVDASLQRLATDYIDVYFAHVPDPQTPIEATLGAFQELVSSGRVRAIAASNYSMLQLAQAISLSSQTGTARYEALQAKFNLIDRDEVLQGLGPLCERAGLSVLAYSPLAGGFLSGKYESATSAVLSARAPYVQLRYGADQRASRVLEAAKQVAADSGRSVAQLSLAWVLAQSVVDVAVIGANTLEQLKEDLAAAEITFREDELERLTVG
jgi:aryl-alcohol dehydrogenase-like predicted oxidoreductase